MARPRRGLTQAQLVRAARIQLIAQLVLTVVLTAVVFYVLAFSASRHHVMAAGLVVGFAFCASAGVALLVYRLNMARAIRRGSAEP